MHCCQDPPVGCSSNALTSPSFYQHDFLVILPFLLKHLPSYYKTCVDYIWLALRVITFILCIDPYLRNNTMYSLLVNRVNRPSAAKWQKHRLYILHYSCLRRLQALCISIPGNVIRPSVLFTTYLTHDYTKIQVLKQFRGSDLQPY